MSRNNINSNLHKIVTVDDKFEPLKIKPEYLPDDMGFSGDYNDLTNKPTIPSKTSELTNDSGFVTAAELPAEQIQSNWAETDNTRVDFIRNKPTLGSAAFTESDDYATAVQGARADTAVQPTQLKTVAFTGSYPDLDNRPTIPTVPENLSDFTNDVGFITADDIPAPVAQVQSDYGQTNTAAVDFIKNKPTLATVATSGDFNDLTNKPAPFDPGTLATVATTGSYNDLLDKPTIPTVPENLSDFTNDVGFITADDIPAPVAQVQSDWTQTDNAQVDFIKNKPTLGTMAAQDSNAINVTGGTLTGVTLDDAVNSLVGADHVHFKVKAAGAITKGDPVKIVGFQPSEDAIRVTRLTAVGDISIGVAHETLDFGEFGAIITKGELKGVNTSAFARGDILYPRTDGTGGFTTVKPTTGTYQALAYVLRAQSNNGALLIDAAEPREIIEIPTLTSELTNDAGFITLDDIPTCEPVSKLDASRPVAFVARGDKIIRLDYTGSNVPVKSKFVSSNIETDWDSRTTLTYIPC